MGVLLLGGCYASSMVDDGVSGTRLRRIVMVPEDGEPTIVGWHDRELGADCGRIHAEDGRLRCVPGGWPLMYYEDSECSAPVWEVRDDLCPRRFRRDTIFPDVCGEAPPFTRVYELEDEVVAIERVYSRTGDGCVPADRSLERAQRTRRVDPSLFVAIEPARGEDTGGPILRDRFVTEDGASGPAGLRDRARDAACRPPYDSTADRQPCLPPRSARIEIGGASCDQTWASAPAGCAAPELAYAADLDACGAISDLRVYAVEAAVPDEERVFGETCGGWPAERAVYRARPADDEAPWLTRSWRGEGRLQLATWSDADGHEVLASARYRDTELGFTCVPFPTADGMRCVPDAVLHRGIAPAPAWATHFADAACSEQAAPIAPCDTPFVVSGSPPPTPCSEYAIDGVYRVGGILERVYHRDASGACVLDESVTGGHALIPIPLATLARLDRITE